MDLLDMAAAFCAAILTGLGVGSGGLFAVYLLLWRQTPQLEAQNLNLLFFLFAAGASIPVHLRRRRVNPAALLYFGAFGIAGAFFGSITGSALDGAVLRRIFGVLLLLCGAAGIFSSLRKPEKRGSSKREQKKNCK